jgi:pterin-4a-carbinolamine dehydratase
MATPELSLAELPEPVQVELGLDGHEHFIPVTRELAEIITAHRSWQRDGRALAREFLFRDFDAAWEFLERTVRSTEDHGRRPDIYISRGHVQLTIRNPHHLDITLAELRLAAKVNSVLDGLTNET